MQNLLDTLLVSSDSMSVKANCTKNTNDGVKTILTLQTMTVNKKVTLYMISRETVKIKIKFYIYVNKL